MDERVPVKEVAIGEDHEKEQPSKSEEAEDITGEERKSEVLRDEKPADETASKVDEEALFLDDRGALELIFRYALTDDATQKSAGTLLKRIFALRDTFARDAIVRVMKRLSNVRFGGGLITHYKANAIRIVPETAVVTVAQFVWMMRWDTLRFDRFDISSYDNDGCTSLIKIADLFHLRELKDSTVETWSRRTVTNPASLDLALALIKNNVDTLKVLDEVPVWRLKEPLPALHLDRFVCQLDHHAPLSQDMGSLAQCTIDKFECFRLFEGNLQLHLSFLSGVNCKEIYWTLNAFHGFESPPEGQTNVHTRQICIESLCSSHNDAFHLRALDVETVRRFFPSLMRISLHVRGGYIEERWMVHNLMRVFAKVQQFSQALASAQGEFALEQSVLMSFKRWSEVHVSFVLQETSLTVYGRQRHYRLQAPGRSGYGTNRDRRVHLDLDCVI